MIALAWFGLGCLVFVSAVAYDIAWAQYTRAAAGGKPLRAATWSTAIYAIGLVGLLGVLKLSIWLVAPEIAGLFVGTYWGVTMHRDHD